MLLKQANSRSHPHHPCISASSKKHRIHFTNNITFIEQELHTYHHHTTETHIIAYYTNFQIKYIGIFRHIHLPFCSLHDMSTGLTIYLRKHRVLIILCIALLIYYVGSIEYPI